MKVIESALAPKLLLEIRGNRSFGKTMNRVSWSMLGGGGVVAVIQVCVSLSISDIFRRSGNGRSWEGAELPCGLELNTTWLVGRQHNSSVVTELGGFLCFVGTLLG